MVRSTPPLWPSRALTSGLAHAGRDLSRSAGSGLLQRRLALLGPGIDDPARTVRSPSLVLVKLRPLTLSHTQVPPPRILRPAAASARTAAPPCPRPGRCKPVQRRQPQAHQPRARVCAPTPVREARSPRHDCGSSDVEGASTRRRQRCGSGRQPHPSLGTPRRRPLSPPRLVGLALLHRPSRRRLGPLVLDLRTRAAMGRFGSRAFLSAFLRVGLSPEASEPAGETDPAVTRAHHAARRSESPIPPDQHRLGPVRRRAGCPAGGLARGRSRPGARPAAGRRSTLCVHPRVPPRRQGYGGRLTTERPLTAQPADLLRTPLSLARAALSHPRALVPVIAAYAPVFAAAGAFVQWNGGIVLGPSTFPISSLLCLAASRSARSR